MAVALTRPTLDRSRLAGTPAPGARKQAPRERFPRWPLFSALALLAFAIAATLFGRLTDIGTLRTPVTYPLAMRDVRFVLQDDETLLVEDAATGALVEAIEPNKDGFIRGALRGIGRERKLRGLAATEPYRIIRWDDGRLTLSDVATGLRVQLDPFGPTNSGAFARFLADRDPTWTAPAASPGASSPGSSNPRSPTP
jgi:putative photosynthetic complex assembly protein